ncbi:hypothetical protein GE21DRAFT_1538 [Neurospora crassa]|uniref:Tyrosinase n=1 Tax=Neurospora crassa (strain ATCC 24698 / 74-OR23-1A / CBS 708.71 / DSM 1257 / FGSC 987) TaxID=367110 RepID=V5IPR9_NEUCR|nr:tyrosinase, variant [Neurospora crassa OR74A]XP_011393252.1 tyrosinase [Neurospora crassa OR74A]ESA44157.1 tyrosinase [Neurospora crassa OR74A]ESA44158.1 tyrosinase, variant [Neurospora crassa OR74A]KHE88431.1 hypothetical protein GE21DRAFT_1538 [Neurospora crassa]|eukprot:XP_011393251.1 tyrosinase, variant [Neurospora crassa OR74A]
MPSMARSLLFLVLAASSLVGATEKDAVHKLQQTGKANLELRLAKSSTCTKENLQIRREWGDISKAERREYIAAMLCLMSKPSQLDQTEYPGAKTRYDDFVAVHMNQTTTIHGTGSFLAWHRYFTWSFERVLREECGYTGSQPYWNWGKWASDPVKSPLFDGSDTSLSGNGLKVDHEDTDYYPAGPGGGCIYSGPFVNMTVRLGPLSPILKPAPAANPLPNGMGDNPRCVRRDITNYLSSRYTRTEDMVTLIADSPDILAFQDRLQAVTARPWEVEGTYNPAEHNGMPLMGIHASGHHTIGGDPGGDFYTSPNDPAFFNHHAGIDRTWAIWQWLDLENRTEQIAGGTAMFDPVNSPRQTLDDIVDLGVVGDQVWRIRDLVSTVDGQFCYTYE